MKIELTTTELQFIANAITTYQTGLQETLGSIQKQYNDSMATASAVRPPSKVPADNVTSAVGSDRPDLSE